ncbi:restriction endonuclease subunit S [uncultured Veillonella sp.]|uniref:restriction endonuclease subunit S n=1 Tax=uncultured Veillonella sp. TaxID=159268 RepID=UPI0026757A57|nr:restriction endonuclease subunit S [uncultured Veillonella sp.]
MNKEKRRVPKLRFPGFTEDWEQRKLGDIATFSKGNGYSKSDLTPSGDPIILYGRLYTNYETTISNVDTFVELKDKSVISQGGEVIVPASGETAEDISRASVVKNQGIIIGGDLNVIKVNHLLDPTFLALTISNGEQQKELSKRAQGKSVVHLHNSDLQEVNLTFPLLNEQKEISTLFEKMDNIITLHQRKLKHLNFKKKALLQKLFPKNGERHPELRFPEFTDAWEQRKLGDIATITGGGTPSTNISEYWNGDIDWYSPVEIGENRYVSRSTRKITKLGLEKSSAKILPVGTVLFTSRAGIGNTAILQAEGCTNQGFQSITPNSKELDTYFLYTMTPKLKRYGEVTGAGSTFVEVSGKQMEQMNLMIPSLEEQKHVSQLFELMDDTITLHQRKLEHLQLQKKALLQQMFV